MMISNEQARCALLRKSFPLFLRFAFREIVGGGTYHHNWHIDAIIWELERVISGDNRHLIVTMPPRHLKSIVISTAWVAWMLGNNPALSFMCVSYGADLAEKHARDCLRIMSSSWYREAFPNVRLIKNAQLDFETSLGGGRLSTSVGGMATGRGADIIILDDPLKADDALSELARDAARTFLYNTLLSRSNDQMTSRIILVMQRLHEADLAGLLIEREGWHQLCLPAIAVDDQLVQVGPDSFYQRRVGCALHPARLSLAKLEEIRARDAQTFASQFQQNPIPAQGNFVDPAWLQYYDEPPSGGITTLSWDTASKTGLSNDWSVGIVARYYQKRWYLLDVFRGRVDFVGLRAHNEDLCRRHGVDRLLIEDAASGQQLIDILRQDCPDGVPFPIPCTPKGDKVTRFAAQASKIENRTLALPRTSPWQAEFITEIIGFPNARHDDQADALAQLLAHPPMEPDDYENYGPILVDLTEPIIERRDGPDEWSLD